MTKDLRDGLEQGFDPCTSVWEIPIDDLVKASTKAGHYWFSKDTMKFFSSRLARTAYVGPGGTFFVSSEKGPSDVRLYTVRQFIWEDATVETVGSFQEFDHRSTAHARARKLAEKPKAG